MSSKKSKREQNGHQLATMIRTSAHDIWLAGLGAYSRAGKEGTRFFDSLVTLGESVERKAREQVARPFRVAEHQVDNARSVVNETWERLETMFERRVARALHSLQIPTQRDVAELARRVESLRAALEELTRPTGPTRRPSRAGATKAGPASRAKARPKKKASKSAAKKRRTTSKAGRTRAKPGAASRA